MVEIPDSLVERLKSRQVVLIAGLGCNELAGAPGWTAFTETLAAPQVFSDERAALARLIASKRLGDAIALIRDLVPHPVLEDAIQKAYPGGAPVPESVKLAAAFPWRAIVTTGFDDLWERALGDGNPDPLRIMVGTDASAQARLGGPGVPLLHLFGRVALPKSLCLGPADARVRLVPSAGLAWLDQLRRRRSLIFVGFRPADPDLVWLSSWLAAQPAEGGPHFLFLDVSSDPDPETESLTWALRTGLEVLPCREGTAEAMARLAKVAASIAARLPPSDADIDLDLWLDRWSRSPADPEPPRILARAEAALRDEERWDRLVELLLRRLDLQDDRHDQIRALAEVARIFRERLAAPERALTAGIVMLRLLPTDDDLWDKLRADARAGGAWQQLVAEATLVAAAAESTPGAGRIWREIARVEREDLDHPEEALAAYRQALIVEPGRRETRDAQAEILRQLGRWEELASVLRAAAAEAGDPMSALALMLEAAELLETNLNDVGGAIATYESALAIAPDSEITALALERLCEREKRWADLARLLDRRARRLPADESRALRRHRAEILIEHLDALDQAAEELEGLVANDPSDRATLVRLEEVYRSAERHDDTLRTLQLQAHAALGPADRLRILRKLAAEGEAHPDGLGRAARALDEILRLEPRDPEAFPALLRIYRSEGPPTALAEVLTRRLEVTETAEAKRELLFALAQTYERELDDPEKALEAYTAAEDAGDRREVIPEAMARLAERLGRWELCAASLQKWAEIAPEAELRAEALLEAALIFSNRLGQSGAAEAALARVLENAPAHPKALATLARLRRDAGDHERAVTLFLEAAVHANRGSEQAELYTAAATLLQNERGQEDRAMELFTRAMAADPDHVPAGERLVDIYAGRGLWSEVEALLDMLARRVDPADTDRLAAIQTRLAGASLEIGNADKALACLTKAYELRPESLAVLRAFADLRARRGEWKRAAELSLSILRLHSEALSASEALEITLRVGRCETELGNADGAIATYRKALTLDPTCRKALEALLALHAAAGNWTEWVVDRQALVPLVEPDERAALWEEIGDACAEKMADRERSEAAYREALKVEGGRRSTLHKLLAIYTEDERWEPAIELLTEIARVEADPAVKAKTLYTAALIWRDEVGQPGFAAGLFERCLDEAPEMTTAFDELGRLHEEAGDWPALARSTRAMLDRLDRVDQPSNAAPRELRLRLWNQLGEVAFRHLRDRKLAIDAFEAAAALDPGDIRREETLAHLYDLTGPEARDRAVMAHQRLIARDYHRTDSYLALAKLYGDSGDLDKQWCVAATLCYLKKAAPAVEAFFRQHRPPAVRVAAQVFTDEIWQRLRHPDQDPLLDAVFAIAAPYLMPLAPQTRESLGLRRRDQIDIADDRSLPVRAVSQIVQTLGLALPDLFRMEGETSQTTLVNLQSRNGPKPGLLLGPATLRRSSFDLVFDLANHTASLKPERFLKFALRTSATLELGLRVVLAITGSAEDPYKGQGEASQLAAYLRRSLPPPVVTELAAAARTLVEKRDKNIDVPRWIASTDLSAARVALALTGELGAATRVLRSELIPRSPVPIHKRMADLIAFSVSEDYFACRRLLGLQVATAPPASS
jgi:tetratricopeptide (TPR) repeat protein